MPQHTREEIHDAFLRIHKEFDRLPNSGISVPRVKGLLSAIAKGYREYKASSDDSWMSRAQLHRALRSVQSDLHRAKQTMDHPVLSHHLNVNHPRHHAAGSASEDVSQALSSVKWALFSLHEDYADSCGQKGRQRRTRTSTRDQFLIPKLTNMVLRLCELDVVRDSGDMDHAEYLIRVLLREWPIVTGNADAENYDKIGKKPLRRTIRAAAESRQNMGEK